MPDSFLSIPIEDAEDVADAAHFNDEFISLIKRAARGEMSSQELGCEIHCVLESVYFQLLQNQEEMKRDKRFASEAV